MSSVFAADSRLSIKSTSNSRDSRHHGGGDSQPLLSRSARRMIGDISRREQTPRPLTSPSASSCQHLTEDDDDPDYGRQVEYDDSATAESRRTRIEDELIAAGRRRRVSKPRDWSESRESSAPLGESSVPPKSGTSPDSTNLRASSSLCEFDGLPSSPGRAVSSSATSVSSNVVANRDRRETETEAVEATTRSHREQEVTAARERLFGPVRSSLVGAGSTAGINGVSHGNDAERDTPTPPGEKYVATTSACNNKRKHSDDKETGGEQSNKYLGFCI